MSGSSAVVVVAAVAAAVCSVGAVFIHVYYNNPSTWYSDGRDPPGPRTGKYADSGWWADVCRVYWVALS